MIVGCVDFAQLIGPTLSEDDKQWFIKEKVLEVIAVMRSQGAKGRIKTYWWHDIIYIGFPSGHRGCVKITGG